MGFQDQGTTKYLLYITNTSDNNLSLQRRDGASGYVSIFTVHHDTYKWVFNQQPYVTDESTAIWHAGNDGSGSGLDADTVDGIQGSNLMTLDGTQTITGNKDFDGTLTYDVISGPTTSTRDKIRLYSTGTYAIGMQSGITYGDLNDWAMTFQFNDENDRGFWWGDTGHSTAQGAMSLSTRGALTVARGINVGGGESDTTWSDYVLLVDNSWQSGTNLDTTVYSQYIDFDLSGAAAFTANRTTAALRIDVDTAISNTTGTSGDRHYSYCTYATNNPTNFVYALNGAYYYAKAQAVTLH